MRRYGKPISVVEHLVSLEVMCHEYYMIDTSIDTSGEEYMECVLSRIR